MSSIWQRMGIVEANNTQAPTETAPAAPATSAPAMQTQVPSAALSGVPSAANATTDVPSVLDTAVVEAQIIQIVETNQAFLAYTTLSDAAAAMAGVIPQEKVRFQAASATTKLTLAEVQPSLDSWKAVVDGEKASFETSYVGSSQDNIAAVEAQIGAVDQELTELTKRLGVLSDQKNDLMHEKVQRESELAKAKIDFNSVIQTVTNRYTVMAANLVQYLGA